MSNLTFHLTIDRPTRASIVDEIIYVADDFGDTIRDHLQGGSQYRSRDSLRRFQMFVDMLDRLDGWGSAHDQPADAAICERERAKTCQEYEIVADAEFFGWLSGRLVSMEELHFDDLSGVHGQVEPETYDNYKRLIRLQARLRDSMTDRLCDPLPISGDHDEPSHPMEVARRALFAAADREDEDGQTLGKHLRRYAEDLPYRNTTGGEA